MIGGALLSGLFTVAVIGFVTRVSRIKDDTAIGIMYTGIFAIGGMLASLFGNLIHIDLYHFLMGQVLAVGTAELWTMGIVAAVVLSEGASSDDLHLNDAGHQRMADRVWHLVGRALVPRGAAPATRP